MDQKRLWCQEAKRLLLENFSATIPDKAKELVMKLGKSREEEGLDESSLIMESCVSWWNSRFWGLSAGWLTRFCSQEIAPSSRISGTTQRKTQVYQYHPWWVFLGFSFGKFHCEIFLFQISVSWRQGGVCAKLVLVQKRFVFLLNMFINWWCDFLLVTAYAKEIR